MCIFPEDIQSEESILLKECAKIHDKDNLLPVYDSDLDDTAESSSEDETPLTQLPPTKSATYDFKIILLI